jgi:hypothetical protein
LTGGGASGALGFIGGAGLRGDASGEAVRFSSSGDFGACVGRAGATDAVDARAST